MELRLNVESLWGLLFWRHQNHDCTGLQNVKGRSANSQWEFILPFPAVPLFSVLRLETGEGIASLLSERKGDVNYCRNTSAKGRGHVRSRLGGRGKANRKLINSTSSLLFFLSLFL